jgi:DNA modification methylase
LKDTGAYFLNIGDKYVGKKLMMIPSKVAIGMQNNGWVLRNFIVWYKPNHMPSSVKDRFGTTWEPIFFFVKDTGTYLTPEYNFDLDSIRIPHKNNNDEKYKPKELLTEEEYEQLPERIKKLGYLPRTISVEEYNKLPSKLKTPGNGDYNGKFKGQKRINLGASPGARASVLGVYYTRKRKHEPNEVEIIKYLREWRKKKKISIEEIDKKLGYKYTAGHWFRLDKGGRSLPSPEDWLRLKNILGFDDKYDKIMTEIHYVLQGVQKNPLGKNPGDMWAMKTGTLQDAHFAIFPEELPKRVILATCPKNGIVLDPFAGSGTTAKVAMELGRKSIMIELNPEYVEIIKKRCNLNKKDLLDFIT